MREQNTLPILFLAFANDRQADGTYLRNLGQEAEQLREVLASAEKAGLCQVETRTSVSAEGILKRFNDPTHKGRIALFHYAGHADDYDLLLESATGERAIADGRGLAAFLRQQNGLQLVFLNACSTRTQVEGLLDAGIAAVIATSRAIDDQTASDFARHFYTALAGGDSISAAFEKAQAALHFVRGDLTRHLRPQQDPHAEHSAAGWPWALYLRKGAEEVAAWNLPGAANDPLFGLPALPALDLPAKPFRDLSWFRRADAPIFFGRGQQIRQLYTVVTDPKTAPIVLFYGQSGVGKSSLLDAGLLPRLEQVHSVVYLRREQEKGLLGTLAGALPPPNFPLLRQAQEPGGGTDPSSTRVQRSPQRSTELTPQSGEGWGGVWRAAEQVANKPLTLILDQVEEHFTRPNLAIRNEMAQFLDALVALFGDRSQRPQGKLILSFRKEWLAEIEKRLSECALPFSKVFLERLDKAGVVEAVRGVARTPTLQQHYGLSLEDGLADEIANDLLKDREAAVAPMLQILLTRLWEEATQRERAKPRFDRTLYDQLRRDGLKLKEFLDRQLARLKEQQREVVDSGLALDLLGFHTTPLGTAEQRDFAAVQKEYQHHTDILAELVRNFQNLYLLVDPAMDQADMAQKSRLAHDTLAPLVRVRFDESDLPGQRARRILETRAVDWDNGEDGSPLDNADLSVVEVGQAGMRLWTSDEQRLVEGSRVARQRREAERQRQEKEREESRQRELILERRDRQRLQAIAGLLAIATIILFGNFSYPYFLSRYIRTHMVYVLADTALIGTNDPKAKGTEGPQIPVKFKAYYIEKYEVTNAQYQGCFSVNACSSPTNPRQFEDKQYGEYPVVYVTAIQAASYCRWVGRRLPTELEWERAARSDPNKPWPWGDEPPTAERVNMPPAGGKALESSVPVTALAAGASRPEGVFQLIGNAWEWTSSPVQFYQDYDTTLFWNGKAASLKPDELLVMRGGGHDRAIERVTERSMFPADESAASIGFRCALDGELYNPLDWLYVEIFHAERK